MKYLLYTVFIFALNGQTLAQANDQPNLYDMSLQDLLQLQVAVASHVVTDLTDQPVSLTAITRDQIELSGARTLNELLTLYVPGYFLVEDQDDTIAGFRGLVPDNNSKTMLLLDGHNLNTEWFWGPPDALLNGLDLDFIERLEVIRGPGSVNLGQGALLGVINIVTRPTGAGNGADVRVSKGQDGLTRMSLLARFGASEDSLHGSLYLAQGRFEGQTLPAQRWAIDRVDQGLSVYERRHHLKRSEFSNWVGKLSYQCLQMSLFHLEQQRDMYNFYRDREVVSQVLQGITGTYQWQLNKQISAQLSGHYLQDDYALASHGNNIPNPTRLIYERYDSGFASVAQSQPDLADALVTPGITMGGTREVRSNIKAILSWREPIPKHNLALGLEYTDITSGLRNSAGDNFIINEQIQTLGLSSDGMGGFITGGNLNDTNTWVKPHVMQVSSFFAEDFFTLNAQISLFAALRLDDHPNWGRHVSPRLGGFYNIDATNRLRLSWQTGFRGAVGVQYAGGFVQDGLLAESNFQALNDIALSQADFNWNGIAADDFKQLKPLRPETMSSYELAINHTGSRLRAQAVMFYNTIENILAASANGYEGLTFGDSVGTDQIGTWNGNWYYQNQQGKLNQFGYELELNTQWQAFLLAASHAHIRILDSDESAAGIYALAEKNRASAYPEDVTRLQVSYQHQSTAGGLAVQYSHIYYWNYFAPTGNRVNGGHLGYLGVRFQPQSTDHLQLTLNIKNLWNSTTLYPINGTGTTDGTDGTPSIEGRSLWLTLSLEF